LGRTLKYVLLAVVLAAMIGTVVRRDPVVLDPLTTVFCSNRSGVVAAVTAVMLLLSFVYGRFWCRNFCPAGAFLALLNRVRLCRRLIPKVVPNRCPYGVRLTGDLDCICCDRCRVRDDNAETEPRPAEPDTRRNIAFLIAAAAGLVVLILCSAMVQRA